MATPELSERGYEGNTVWEHSVPQNNPSENLIMRVMGGGDAAALFRPMVRRVYRREVFEVREDEPAPRIGAGLHRTP